MNSNKIIEGPAVTITVNANANGDATTGAAVVTGTVQCTRTGTISLGIQLNQTQKTGTTTTVGRGSGATSVNGYTATQPWAITATPWSGRSRVGLGQQGVHIQPTGLGDASLRRQVRQALPGEVSREAS